MAVSHTMGVKHVVARNRWHSVHELSMKLLIFRSIYHFPC